MIKMTENKKATTHTSNSIEGEPLLGQQGVAILFVMTAIILLTTILTDFSFETQINKLRAYNSQDQLQARLNAEAGLKLSLIRLELYQVARNLMEKNKRIKKSVSVRELNEIWNIPFLYPMPLGAETKLVAKLAIEKFMNDSLLEGEIVAEIRNASHLINLNLLRMAKPQIKTYHHNRERETEEDSSSVDLDKMILNLEQRLVELFRQKFDRRLEDDDEFSKKYSDVSPEALIKEIKFYISDAHKEFGAEVEEIRALYAADGIPVKHAPLEGLSELYLMRGWDDELVDMIKQEVTVHGVVAIDLNEITEPGLRLLIPEIDDEQVKDFFEYRNDPKVPSPFNSLDDFKSYIVHTAKILSSSEMTLRIKKFSEAGIQFGVHGSLFQVISTGRYGRSEYTLHAFIEIPIRPTPPVVKKNDGNSQDHPSRKKREKDDNPDNKGREKNTSRSPKKPPPPQFMRPRVVEITVY